MRRERFIINKERRPARCEICHQADLFDADSGQCGRCQMVAAMVAPIVSVKEKPLFIELIQEVTLAQIVLLLLLGGMLTGIAVDITRITLPIAAQAATLTSAFASLFLMLPSAKKTHPLCHSLLFSLSIAPLGWLLLAAMYWLAQVLS